MARHAPETPHAPPDFHALMDGVLDAPLTPEVIDSYADTALNGLIGVLDDAKMAYDRQPTIRLESEQAREDAATYYFGLSDVSASLAHIINLSDEIQAVDTVIERMRRHDTVYLPPDELQRSARGDVPGKPVQERQVIPRLKTILFLLAKEFDIDISDENELRLDDGITTKEMWRAESYVRVEAPAIRRVILVSDESGNVTFVFDTAALHQAGMEPASLTRLSKIQLKALIRDTEGLGVPIQHKRHYIPRIIAALRAEDLSKQTLAATQPDLYPPSYLRQEVRDPGRLSAPAFAKVLGVNPVTVKLRVNTLLEQDEDFARSGIKYGHKGGITLDTAQQERVRSLLADEGLLVDDAPDGYLSVGAFARSLGTSGGKLGEVIEAIGDDLGGVRTYRFHAERVPGLSPGQQLIVLNHLLEQGYDPEITQAPAGIEAVDAIADACGVSRLIVNRTIAALGDTLGATRPYRFGAFVTTGYRPEQQVMIRENLALGRRTDEIPEGVRSIGGLADKLGVSHGAVSLAVNTLGDRLGTVDSYKFMSDTVPGLTTDQQDIVTEHIRARGLLAEKAPEGVRSVPAFARHLGVTVPRVEKAIALVDEEIGPRKTYRFRTRSAQGLTAAQQAVIAQRIHA